VPQAAAALQALKKDWKLEQTWLQYESLSDWVSWAEQKKKLFVNLLKNCCYCLNVLIWHEKSTQNVREKRTAKIRTIIKNRSCAKNRENEKSTLLDFFPIFISQTSSFQEKKLHVFHWCHLPQDFVAVVAPAVIMDRKLTRALWYHSLIQNSETYLQSFFGGCWVKKNLQGKKIKNHQGVRKRRIAPQSEQKNAKFSIVSVYIYDQKELFLHTLEAVLKSFPCNLARVIEPKTHPQKMFLTSFSNN